jgi:hypothetical protein
MQITPLKLVAGFAAVTALSATLAITRIPAPKEVISLKSDKLESDRILDQAWAASFQEAVEKKTVRVIELAPPKKVITERVAPTLVEDAPVTVPPVAAAREVDGITPVSRHRRHAEVRDVCTRHGMHKKVTRGGKSWRCSR